MPVHNSTTEGKTALFDSTERVAFGPIFDSEQECDDFLQYADEYYGVDDVRKLDAKKLDEIHAAFVAAQAVDDDE